MKSMYVKVSFKYHRYALQKIGTLLNIGRRYPIRRDIYINFNYTFRN